MGKANSLSRRPNWEIGVEKNNKDKTLVKPEWLEMRRIEAVEIIVDKVDLLEEVRKSKVKDNEIVKAIEEMKQTGVKMLRDKEWRKVDSVIYKEGKVYCRKAKLQARIKPTALCSVIDKENSIEFLLDFLHYLYNYYMVCALLSHAYHVTHCVMSCDVMP